MAAVVADWGGRGHGVVVGVACGVVRGAGTVAGEGVLVAVVAARHDRVFAVNLEFKKKPVN